jgi:hypothetical protein
MADKKRLALIAWAYSGVTIIVFLAALVVVTAHIHATAEARAGLGNETAAASVNEVSAVALRNMAPGVNRP